MLLLEHDAKTLLEAAGVPVPSGWLADRSGDPVSMLGPWIVKAQVPIGGRGKAGGIRAPETQDDLAAHLAAMIGMTLKGHPVRECRIERRVAGAEADVNLGTPERRADDPSTAMEAARWLHEKQVRQAARVLGQCHASPFARG